MRTKTRRLRALCVLTLIALLPGCAHMDQSDEIFTRWSVRGAGAVASFALHEVCHIVVGQAMGANVQGSWRGMGPHLEFSGLSRREHQTVSIMGNACTGIAAEWIVDTGSHKRSNFAWGAAAFHAVNAFGYAFSNHGDAEYWEDSGGSREAWQLINAGHSSRIGAHLAWDSEAGQYLRKRWRFGAPPDLDGADPLDFSAEESGETPVVMFEWEDASGEKALPPVSLLDTKVEADLERELPPVSLPPAPHLFAR